MATNGAYSAVGFINRLLNKISFSDNSLLDVTPFDMGEEQSTIEFSDRGVSRLRAATGTVVSLQIFTKVEARVSMRKTSPLIGRYRDCIINNGYIGGTVTLWDDAGNKYVAYNPSITIESLGALNGTEPSITFIVEADLPVNTEALAPFAGNA